MKAAARYLLTVLAGLPGCYRPHLWLRRGGAWLLAANGGAGVAGLGLAVQPAPADGRVYIVLALTLLWLFDGMRPGGWELLGGAVILLVWPLLLRRRGRQELLHECV